MSSRISARSRGRAPRSACICWLQARDGIVPKLHKQQAGGGTTQGQSPAPPLTSHMASAKSLSLVVSSGDVTHGRGVVQSRDVVPVPACRGTRC